jgi:hypothetical protein
MPNERGLAGPLFVAAFFGALFQLLRGEGVALGAGFETLAVARSLARNGTFAERSSRRRPDPRPICRRRTHFRSPSG